MTVACTVMERGEYNEQRAPGNMVSRTVNGRTCMKLKTVGDKQRRGRGLNSERGLSVRKTSYTNMTSVWCDCHGTTTKRVQGKVSRKEQVAWNVHKGGLFVFFFFFFLL